jgi:hypothetical protein
MFMLTELSVGCEINHNRRSKGYDSNNREIGRTVLVWLKGTTLLYFSEEQTIQCKREVNNKDVINTDHDPLIRVILINQNMIDC